MFRFWNDSEVRGVATCHWWSCLIIICNVPHKRVGKGKEVSDKKDENDQLSWKWRQSILNRSECCSRNQFLFNKHKWTWISFLRGSRLWHKNFPNLAMDMVMWVCAWVFVYVCLNICIFLTQKYIYWISNHIWREINTVDLW